MSDKLIKLSHKELNVLDTVKLIRDVSSIKTNHIIKMDDEFIYIFDEQILLNN